MSDRGSFMIHTDSKLVSVGNSLAIILPKIILDNYNLKKGDNLRMYLHELGIIIERPQQEKEINPIIRSPVAP